MLERSEEAKFQIDVVDRLSAALPRLSSADVVLLDLGLPDSEGVTTIRRVRAAAAIPIIVLTAQEEREIGKQALAAGATDFFMKATIESQVLARAILRAFKNTPR